MKKTIVLPLALLSALAGCTSGSQPGYVRNSGFVFGTEYSFIYQCDSDLCDIVMERLGVYDRSLSVYNKTSLLSQLNNGDSVVADADLLCVLRNAKYYNEMSNGAFDVTVEPLSRVWRFGDESADDTISVEQWRALAAQVDTVLPYVGMDKLSIEGDVIHKADRRTRINANALAEGYGIDLAADALEACGVANYMVEIGGEIHCRGLNPRGEKWRIGIDKPIEGAEGLTTRGSQMVIGVSDCAVSTSGNYRQCYHVADGRTVQHTINPRTGMPVDHALKSVTIVGPRTMVTDAVATCVMVLGPDSMLTFIDRIPDVEAYAIYTDSTGNEAELMTKGFEAMIVKR